MNKDPKFGRVKLYQTRFIYYGDRLLIRNHYRYGNTVIITHGNHLTVVLKDIMLQYDDSRLHLLIVYCYNVC